METLLRVADNVILRHADVHHLPWSQNVHIVRDCYTRLKEARSADSGNILIDHVAKLIKILDQYVDDPDDVTHRFKLNPSHAVLNGSACNQELLITGSDKYEELLSREYSVDGNFRRKGSGLSLELNAAYYNTTIDDLKLAFLPIGRNSRVDYPRVSPKPAAGLLRLFWEYLSGWDLGSDEL